MSKTSVPLNWTIARINQVCDLSKEKGVEGKLPYLEIGNVDTSQKSYSITGKPSVKGCRLAKQDDLLISRVRPTRGAITLVREKELQVSSAFAVLRNTGALADKYLVYFLAWNSNYLKYLGENCTGTMYPTTSDEVIGNYEIPIAPFKEQERIVVKVDELLSEVESGIKDLRVAQAELKRYRVSVLVAACSGKLVPTEVDLARAKGRNYESGADLLTRILKERSRKWTGRGKYKDPLISSTSNLPTLPEGWTWAQFGYLGKDPFNTVQTGPFGAQLHNTEFTKSGVPVIAVGNLTWMGFRTEDLYFVSPTKAVQLARYDVWSGDLLFARSGATLGKVCVAPDSVQDWRMTGHILRARLNQQLINPKIAVYALAALPAVRRQVLKNVRGVTRPGFNTALLESIFIPVPPIAEQGRIVVEVERLLSIADEVEGILSANLKRAGRLRESILREAFAGKLVPSDASDEHAAALLERISVKRASATIQKKVTSKAHNRRKAKTK